MRKFVNISATALVVAGLAVTAVGASARGAQGPSIAVNPTSGPVATGIGLRGSDFGARGVEGTVTFNGQSIGHFTVQSNHTWNDTIYVPDGTPPGSYQIVATAGSASASATFTVTG